MIEYNTLYILIQNMWYWGKTWNEKEILRENKRRYKGTCKANVKG
jgi:hypothetical protein